MSTTTATSETGVPQAQGQLIRVLCGVDGSRADAEAVRQAALLAGPTGSVEIVCVTYVTGVGPTAVATIAPGRAEAALRKAQVVAKKLGARPVTRLVHNPDDWRGLAGEAGDADVLVIGSHTPSRAEGVVTGRTATRALHESAVPVLIARAGGGQFPRTILVASDGSPDSSRAAAIAARIAAEHSASVSLLTVGSPSDAQHRHALGDQAAQLRLACGVEPPLIERGGSPRTAIVDAAAQLHPGLIVIGSGGKRGIRAIGSVSEHVAHHAPCSVLVARARRGGDRPV